MLKSSPLTLRPNKGGEAHVLTSRLEKVREWMLSTALDTLLIVFPCLEKMLKERFWQGGGGGVAIYMCSGEGKTSTEYVWMCK